MARARSDRFRKGLTLLAIAVTGNRAARQRLAEILRIWLIRVTPRILAPSLLRALAHFTPLAPVFSADWLRRFDTPGGVTLRYFQDTKAAMPNVFFVLCCSLDDVALALRTRSSLDDVIGLNWSGVIAPRSPISSADIGRLREIFASDPRFTFEPLMDANAPVLFLEAGAIPRPHGPRVLVEALLDTPGAMVAYSDEARVDSAGRPERPWFKPDFSPLLAEQGVLLGRMVAMRSGLEGCLDRQALFVLSAALGVGGAGVLHVPHVLFFDVGTPVVPFELPLMSSGVVIPMVSILIPTRDRWDLLEACLDSIDCSDWPRERLEIIIVDNGSSEPAAMSGLRDIEIDGRARVLRDDGPFNYSRLNNRAATVATGDILILLNNDTEVLDRQWIRKLVSLAALKQVGAVGPKLLYPDRTVQHGGVILGIQGVAAHAHVGLSSSDGGYAQLANLTHEVSTVTGACMAVSRENFLAVGGLDESFPVSFNDVVFCLDLLQIGLYNVYLAEPLLIHHESKSRGYDDTPAKREKARLEAAAAWLRHGKRMRRDFFYSPSLSLDQPYVLAFAPRRRPVWDRWLPRAHRVMMLSVTHERGHGVPVVLKLQAQALLAHGFEVVVAGPVSPNDLDYPGCTRIDILDPRMAALTAVEQGIDVVVAHTPPFFSVARWTGGYPRVLAYDYGEPPPLMFDDGESRQALLNEKDQGLLMCDAIFAISDAVAAEGRVPVRGVIPLGNTHLGCWDSLSETRRDLTRKRLGWGDRFVVLNVCRFHRAERNYKGIGTFAQLRRALNATCPNLAKRAIFVLCGKGNQDDIEDMRAEGLEVFANVSDIEITDLYCAADVYANFSTWEGYNLGIGQALAMGLGVVASDIPAHRAFGIPVTNDPVEAARALSEMGQQISGRTVKVWDWGGPLAQFVEEVKNLCPR